jgi:dihydrodipicolinate synthase/N-acetylneuraminate lyase
MSTHNKTLAGVYPVFHTPYHADETIDYATLSKQFDYLLSHGVDGVVMAMVSETLRLSESERKQLAEATCQSMRSRGGVIISVGAESSRMAADYAKHAERSGADALMAIPPVATNATQSQVMDYFARLFDAVSIPIVVQDASAYVGNALSIDLYIEMLDRYGDRVYFKPEASPIGPRLSALRDASAGRARVFEGTGGLALLDSCRRGIVGTMPGADLIDLIVALWNAMKRGDDETAYRIHGVLCPIVVLQNSLDAFLSIEKHLLVRRGIFTNTLVRGPVGFVLDRETRDEIDRLFDRGQKLLTQLKQPIVK